MAAINHALPKQSPSPYRRILRLPAVKDATGLGRTKIYELMKEGSFPKARRIAGAQAVGWDSLEIDAWIAEQLGEVA